MSGHTPGPWEAFGPYEGSQLWAVTAPCHEPDFSVNEDGRCPIHGINPMRDWGQFTEADARLIAAAPDMLAALKEAHRMLANTPEGATVERAIAKAEGRS